MHQNVIKLDELYPEVCSTATSIEALKQAIKEHKVNPYEFTYANIDYDANIGIGAKNSPRFYPLKVGNRVSSLWIPHVTSGYRGEGPWGMIEALKILKFDIDEDRKAMIFAVKRLDVNFCKNT